jgi:hypothetical protein
MDIARHWRERGTRYRMEAIRNRQSGELRFPPRPLAPGERAEDWEQVTLSGKGELYSFAMVHRAAHGFEQQGPYPVALVQLAEGPLVAAQLTDCDEAELRIGMPLEMVTRRLKDSDPDGVLVYGYKFRPQL